jgi:hypothetical protein
MEEIREGQEKSQKEIIKYKWGKILILALILGLIGGIIDIISDSKLGTTLAFIIFFVVAVVRPQYFIEKVKVD